MSALVVFLDDGGVMNDNGLRGPQWQRLVGAFFAPILGGTPTAWAEVNRVVTSALFEAAAWRERLEAAHDYRNFDRAYLLDWLGCMCDAMDIPRLPDAESLDLARRAVSWIRPRVRAAFPGATAAIRLLHARGYPLHTASGESSADLASYLTAMGVRECFGRLYGPDLLDTFKVGPNYYARLLADAAVAPADALVVDDSRRALAWAAQVGARTVLVGTPSPLDAGPPYGIASLADLPALLASIDEAGTSVNATRRPGR